MVAAIILAGGSGSRMHTEKAKQYLTVRGVPLIVHALRAFQNSPVDEIVLVVRQGDEEYVRTEIVEKYEIGKVNAIVHGGKERFDSVWQGLSSIAASLCGEKAFDEAVVLIHDGARPFVTSDMICASIEAAEKYGACTVAVPVKDTIKVVDESGFGAGTPDRSTLYQVQTPQTFRLPLILEAHRRFREDPRPGITDDTMLVEEYLQQKCYIVPGDYKNLKVTTPEDILLAETILGICS